MEQQFVSMIGDLQIQPSASSSAQDFDFIEGNWMVHNKKLASRLTSCNEWIEFDATQVAFKVLLGKGNIDRFSTDFGGEAFEGMTVRLFDPVTRLWSIYWADSNNGTLDTPVLGSFENSIGHFYARDTWKGTPVLVKFRWDARDTDQPIWSQAFSTDNGNTWEWNWYMYFDRQ